MSAKGLIDLAMDQDSRMQRAREQGFEDDTVYRGLYGEYDPVKAGHYQCFTSSPQDAGEYGNSVVAAKIKRGKNLEYDARGRNFNNLSLSGLPAAVYDNLHWSIKNSLSQTARSDDIAHAAKAAGYDSVTLKNIYDKADNEIPLKPAPANRSDADLLSDLGIDLNDPILSGNLPQRQEAIVAPKDYNTANVDIVFDPSNIRSINAAFDPRYLNSSNLMGDGPSAADLQPDERLRNLLNNVKTLGAIAGKSGVENISDCASVQILLQLDTDWWPEVTPDSAKEKVANVWWSARNAAAKSESLARNKVTNEEMPMDYASRMMRAREQGLSSRGYHGTNADEFDAFDLAMLGTGSGGKDTKHGFYFSGRRDTADAYRESYPQIKPDKFKSHYGISIEHAQKEYAHLRDNLVSKGYDVRRGSRLQDRAFLKDNPDLKDDIDQLRNVGDRLNPYNYDNPRGGIYPRDWVDDVMMGRTNHYALPDISRMRLVDMECQAWDESKQSAIAQLAKDEGFDGVIFKNMQDSGWFGGAGLDDITLVFDPANIRSVNAAFDPRYLNSSKLMGDGPSAADLQPDERLRNLLNNVKTLGAIAGKRGVENISDCASVQILLQLDTDWWPEVTPGSAKEKVANVWWSARNAAAKSERLAQNKESNTQSPQTHSGISNETKMYAPSPG